MLEVEAPERLPDVFFIGYLKAGSTFLHQYLRLHPSVFVDYRAGRFVSRTSPEPLTPSDMAAMAAARTYVAQDEKLCLSVLSTAPIRKKEFMFEPELGEHLDDLVEYSPVGMAERIKLRCPDAKILICIREQVDWLESSYRYFLNRMPPRQRTLSDFFRTPRGRLMLRIGHHDELIETYLQVFGSDRVKVLRFEWLRDRPEYFVSQLCGFLEIETHLQFPEPTNVGRSYAVSLAHRLNLPTLGLPKLVSSSGRKLLNALPQRAFNKGVLSASDRERLKVIYSASNSRTSDVLDLDSSPI